MKVLNKESGVYGLSGGISSDFRDLGKAYDEGKVEGKRAFEAYSYRVAKYIGAYTAAMNGTDAVVFTAGVGENDPLIRTMICGYLGYLGVTLDEKENAKRGEETVISAPDSKVSVLVVPTNEELAIARETVRLVNGI